MDSRSTPAWRAITSWWWVTALVALLVNDHLLKAVAPGAVTGKLSDVAGLIVAPPLVAVASSLVLRRNVDGRVGVALVSLGFSAVQVLPAVAGLVADGSRAVFGAGTVTPDVTDLWALPALLVPWWASRDASSEPQIVRETSSGPSRRSDLVLIALGGVACLATSAAAPIGVTAVALDGDAVVVGVGSAYRGDPVDRWFRSVDGGATWEAITGCGVEDCAADEYEPCGPLGCLKVERDRILLVGDGGTSTVHLASRRVEALEARADSHEVSLGPAVVGRSRAYVAAGSAGLLVSDDLQEWRYIAAGGIEPATDRWWTLLGPDLAGVLVAVALAAAYLVSRGRWRGRPPGRVALAVALLVSAALIGAAVTGLATLDGRTGFAVALVLPIGLVVLAGAVLAGPDRDVQRARDVAVALGLGALIGGAIVLLAGSGALPFDLRVTAWPAALAVALIRGRAAG